MTKQEFAWKVLEGEGLEYAILDYFEPLSDDIKHPRRIGYHKRTLSLRWLMVRWA